MCDEPEEMPMKIGRFIRAGTISDAWYRGLNLIWNNSEMITDERGSKIKELLGLMVVIQNPYVDQIPKDTAWNAERLEEYAKQLILGTEQDFVYTYGQRLRNWNGTDQIDFVIRKLKESPSSRRATCVTWMPSKDTKAEEVPCMILLDFKLRGELNLTAVFRSHDFYGAAAANWYALSRLLEHVSQQVGVTPGKITSVSISAHIYEYDWDDVSAIVG
ncbi:MAG: thymidylate synthase [Methanocellales archaeon]|nr:thymidylate synthase [Methanocellales archaeon]MDD3421065.1 thymidylate synthase [Methanocellales archaeon]MDD4898059.1 thymidylate synthase [Methanocellales archaeon]MDD5447184.1 thymidylate synthase [Methanocellales archaeon]